MAARARRSATTLVCAALGIAAGCSVGEGSGEAKGSLLAPDCSIDDSTWSLRPDFFGAEYFEDTVTITLQRGGDYQVKSDGLLIEVSDLEAADSRLNEPLPVAFPAPAFAGSDDEITVQASLYLNRTCGRDEVVGLVGTSGIVAFRALGGGRIDEDDRIEGDFSIYFEEPSGGPARAELDGFWSFRYTRGRPAQRFP